MRSRTILIRPQKKSEGDRILDFTAIPASGNAFFPVAFSPTQATTYGVMMILIGLAVAAGFLLLAAIAFTYLVKG